MAAQQYSESGAQGSVSAYAMDYQQQRAVVFSVVD